MIFHRLLPSLLSMVAFAIVSARATSIIDPAAQEAIESRYELWAAVRSAYAEAGCNKSWGPFPETLANIQPGFTNDSNTCACRMLWDVANESQRLFREIEEVDTTDILVDGTTPELDSAIMARTANSQVPCSGGSADGYPCQNVDLIGHFPLRSLQTTDKGRPPLSAQDIWGWTNSDDGREFVIMTVFEGYFFFEIFPDSDPNVLGYLPPTSGTAFQSDVKVINNYAYMGSEASNQGLQIFDMKRLLDIDSDTDCVSEKYCQELTNDAVYSGTSQFGITNSHNVVVNPDNPNTVYVVGAGSRSGNCQAGLHVVDVSDPNNPTTAGCFADDGYVHDAQCVNYNGPDPNYSGVSEICFCFNEDTVTIVDVTDKSNMSIISKINYGRDGYTHQGWLSSDHSHVVFGDENDERFGLLAEKKTRTLVVNVEDLSNPGTVKEFFFGTINTIDHNLYIVKATAKGQDYDPAVYGDTDLIYEANFEGGLRILQVLDYGLAKFEEIAYFDTFPSNDKDVFFGAWSNYPFFESGVIVVSDILGGLFVLKPTLEDALLPPDDTPNCTDDPGFQFGKKDCASLAASEKPIVKKRKICNFKNKEGTPISDFCRDTCGKVGVGICKETRRN